MAPPAGRGVIPHPFSGFFFFFVFFLWNVILPPIGQKELFDPNFIPNSFYLFSPQKKVLEIYKNNKKHYKVVAEFFF